LGAPAPNKAAASSTNATAIIELESDRRRLSEGGRKYGSWITPESE